MLWIAILAVSVGAVYANSLSGAFVIDDQASVVENQTIRDLGNIGGVLASRPDSPVAGRPIPNLTLAVNYAIGGLEPLGYHVVNVLLHLACVLLAFGVARRALALPSLRPFVGGHAVPLAFAAALVWAVHPLNTEVVDYITQRTESLMAVFLLATLYAAIRAARAARPGRWEALAVASCALGMGCKEAMALAPLLVALFDRAYVFDSWAEAVRSRKRLYAGLAATWLLTAALLVSGARSASVGFSLGVSSWTYLLNQAQMIARYLHLTVWPDSLVAFYGWPRPLTLGDVLPEMLLVVALLTITVLALWRTPKIGYPAAWFFLLLAPTSSFIPITTEVGAERRMYLPLLALVVLAVVGVHLLLRRLGARSLRVAAPLEDGEPGAEAGSSRVAAIAGAVLLLSASVPLAWATMARNREYVSELTLARTMVARWPTGIAHHIVGIELLEKDRRDEALEHLRKAVASGDSRAGYPLGMTLYESGESDAALECLESFVSTADTTRKLVPRWLEPPPREVVPARMALASIYTSRGKWPEAEEQARRVLQADPGRDDARIVHADALFAQRRWREAADEYGRYLRNDPDNAQALINLGISDVGLGEPMAAREAFERAVAAAPDSAEAHQYLAMILFQTGDARGAADHARAALDLGADDPILRDILARVSS